MIILLYSLLLTPPVYTKQSPPTMPCVAVTETAEVVLEAPGLSDKKKAQILRRLFGTYAITCISGDAND